MINDNLVECDYCGKTIDTSKTEKCTKCKKYINEDPNEYDKYISQLVEESEK